MQYLGRGMVGPDLAGQEEYQQNERNCPQVSLSIVKINEFRYDGHTTNA